MTDFIQKKVDSFREEYKKAYSGILNKQALEYGNPWFESFLRQALIEQHNRTVEECAEVVRETPGDYVEVGTEDEYIAPTEQEYIKNILNLKK